MIRPESTFRFYERSGDTFRCVVCRIEDGLHSATCPVVAVHDELEALVGHFGVFLADVKETVQTINQLLTGDPSIVEGSRHDGSTKKPH